MANFGNGWLRRTDLELCLHFSQAFGGNMTSQGKSMKDVVAELRRDSVGALVELFELDVAVGEIALNAHGLAAAVRELAAEAKQLATTPGVPSPARLQALASYASSASTTAESQAMALAELRRGLAAWRIAG